MGGGVGHNCLGIVKIGLVCCCKKCASHPGKMGEGPASPHTLESIWAEVLEPVYTI